MKHSTEEKMYAQKHSGGRHATGRHNADAEKEIHNPRPARSVEGAGEKRKSRPARSAEGAGETRKSRPVRRAEAVRETRKSRPVRSAEAVGETRKSHAKRGSAGDAAHRSRPGKSTAGNRRGKSTAKRTSAARGGKNGILHSRFYQVYFLLVLLCIIGIGFGANYLDGVLKDYESAQPKYVAQQAAQLFVRGDYEAILGLDSSMQDVAEEDRAYYIDQLRALAVGREVGWSEAYSGNEDERRYRVTLDGEKFAEFSLVPSGAQTKGGNRLWRLDTVRTSVRIEAPVAPTPTPEPTPLPGFTCSITVPSSFAATVDGRMLDANDVVEAELPIVPAGMLPEGVTNPTMVRYAFLSETGTPEIRLIDQQGNAQTPVQDGAYSWRCELPQSPELEEKYGEAALEVAKRIAKYSTREVSQDSVLKRCAKGSPAYERIKSFDSSLGKKPKGSSFENVVVSDFYSYSGNCFSCKVRFDYIPRFGKESKTYPTAYTLYFIREGDNGKLYSFSLG